MKKKIVGIFVCMLLVATSLPITGTVIAGDEEDPEIEDEDGDTSFFIFTDILSAWFLENPDEPDYLYTSMKFKNLIWNWRIERGVGWKYDGESYYSYYRSGYYPRENWKIVSQTDDNDVAGSYNLITGIITWKIPKSRIGNPKPGDVLTKTWAFGGVEPIKIMGASFVLFGDYAPDDGYGREYIIKY